MATAAATPTGKVNYYNLLGIERNASAKEIKQGYRRSAVKFHPDRASETASEEWMKEVNKAYEILSDKEQRAEYDRERLQNTNNQIWTGEFLTPLPNAVRYSEGFRSQFRCLERQNVTHELGQFPLATQTRLHKFLSGPLKQITSNYSRKPKVKHTRLQANRASLHSGRYDILLDSITQVVECPGLHERASHIHASLVRVLQLAQTTRNKKVQPVLSQGTRVPIIDLSGLNGSDLQFLLSIFTGDSSSASSSQSLGSDELLDRLLELVPQTQVHQPPAAQEAKPQSHCGTCCQQFGFFSPRSQYVCSVCGSPQCSSCPGHVTKVPRYGRMEPQKVCKACATNLSSKDGHAWMELASQFLKEGAVDKHLTALGCFTLALSRCDHLASQFCMRLARELIHHSMPELALPLIATLLKQSKDVSSETLKLHLLGASALKCMADHPKQSWEDKWLLLFGSKQANLEASCVHDSLANSTDVPELEAKAAEIDFAVLQLEKQQQLHATNLAKQTCASLNQAWESRDWERLLKIVTAQRDNNLMVITNARDTTMEALQQFVAKKIASLPKMPAEDRFALIFFRGILNLHNHRYNEGLADIEAVAWSGHHSSWARKAGVDILLGLEAESSVPILPHHNLIAACKAFAKCPPTGFNAATTKLLPPFLAISSETLHLPSKLHWSHLCVQGLNLVAHRKYEEAVEEQVQKGKWTNKEAGFAYIDLIPACEHPAEIAVCFLSASLWFLEEIKRKVGSTRIPVSEVCNVHALKTLVLTFTKQALGVAQLYLHPGMRMYVSRVAFGVALKATQYAGKLATSEDSKLLVEILNSLIYSCRFCPFWNPPIVRVSEAVLLNIISGRLHSEFVLGLQHIQPEQSPVHIHELCYQLYENDLRFVRQLQDPTGARNRAMQEMLHEKGWTFEDVSNLLSSPLSPRTNEGWLKQQPTLGVPLEYAEVKGFAVNLDPDSPSVQLLVEPANGYSRKVGLFSQSDVDTVLHLKPEDVFPIFFSLEQPSTSEHFHPFQEFRYMPESLHGTTLLHTLFETDYLLKSFSVGVEVSAKPPFNQRACHEGLTQHLPPELHQALKSMLDRGFSRNRMHRFWIQADELVYDVAQNGLKVTYHVGSVKMVVRSHPLFLGPDGNLLDTPEDDDPNSPEAKFAEDLTKNYNLLSQYFPIFARLRELCKLQFLGLIIENQLHNLEETAKGSGINIPDHVLRNIQEKELQQRKSNLKSALSDMKQQVGSWPSAEDPSEISAARQKVERGLPSNITPWQLSQLDSEIESVVQRALQQRDEHTLSQVVDALMQLPTQRLSRSSLESYVRHWISNGRYRCEKTGSYFPLASSNAPDRASSGLFDPFRVTSYSQLLPVLPDFGLASPLAYGNPDLPGFSNVQPTPTECLSAEDELIDFVSSTFPLTTRQDIRQLLLEQANQQYTAFKNKVDRLRTSATARVEDKTREYRKSNCKWVPAALRKQESNGGTSLSLSYGGVLINPKLRKGFVPRPSPRSTQVVILQHDQPRVQPHRVSHNLHSAPTTVHPLTARHESQSVPSRTDGHNSQYAPTTVQPRTARHESQSAPRRVQPPSPPVVSGAVSTPLDQPSGSYQWDLCFLEKPVSMVSQVFTNNIQIFQNGVDIICASQCPPSAEATPSGKGTPKGQPSTMLLRASLIVKGVFYSGDSTKELRHPRQQIAFRKRQGMVGRKVEASHIVSLQLIKCIVEMAGCSFDSEELRTWVNRIENFENVSRYTNRSTYTKIDNALERKFHNGELLTTEEEERATIQVNVVLEDCPKSFRPHIQKFFQRLRTKGGKSIWEMVAASHVHVLPASKFKPTFSQATGVKTDDKAKGKGPN